MVDLCDGGGTWKKQKVPNVYSDIRVMLDVIL